MSEEDVKIPERAVCLNCIDGRAQLPVIRWIVENCRVDCVDMITEPGMDGLLADPSKQLDEILRKVRLSIRVNNAVVLVIAAHHDCRGNPVTEAEHRRHLSSAIERFKKEIDIPVKGLWVNEQWQGEAL